MTIEQLLQQVSPNVQAFIVAAMQQGDNETVDIILQIANTQGIPALEQAIQEFLGGAGGAPQPGAAPAPGMPPAMPPGADAGMPPSGAMPPGMDAGMPPSMPPPDGVTPPPGMMAPPNPPPPMPPNPEQEAAPQVPKSKKVKVPKYNPPPIRRVPKPTIEQIYEDAAQGRAYWAERDTRIQQDTDLYHLTYDSDLFGDKDATLVGGTVIHRRSQPETLVSLVTSLATARRDKVTVEIEPRADSDEYENAAQYAEDFVVTLRELDEEKWLETRINEPPLPRKEAGLAALEGGFGWSWYVDAEDEEHPFQYEIVPLSQLYDVGHACTRQYTLPLGQARMRHENIAKMYPIEGKGRQWDTNQKVRIICHATNNGEWKSIVWEDVAGTGRSRAKVNSILGNDAGSYADENGEDRRWIEKPRRVNYGFRYYNYVVWGGSPSEPLTSDSGNGILAFKGYGVLTALRKTFRLMDLFISAIATGALANVEPAYLRGVAEGVNRLKVKKLDRRPGVENVVGIEEAKAVLPLRWDVSQGSDATNLMNSLIAEMQDVNSPALSGAASGASGVQQMASTQQASQLVVAPIIDALESWYALMHKQRLILALRYSSDEKYNVDESDKPQTLFDSYTRRSHRGETSGQYGTLKPSDIHKSGVRVIVKYHDRNLQEELALSQMVTNLVGSHLLSQETALRRMGVKNPKAELQRIFTDGAFMDKTVLKAIIENAVYNSGNEQLIAAWNKAFYADTFGNKGSEAAQPGAASMPANQPGANVQGVSSAIQSPMGQQMGMMGG